MVYLNKFGAGANFWEVYLKYPIIVTTTIQTYFNETTFSVFILLAKTVAIIQISLPISAFLKILALRLNVYFGVRTHPLIHTILPSFPDETSKRYFTLLYTIFIVNLLLKSFIQRIFSFDQEEFTEYNMFNACFKLKNKMFSLNSEDFAVGIRRQD